MKIEIEKNIPVPSSGPGTIKYPWLKMKVGDSFFVPNGNERTMSSNAYSTGKRYNTKYSVRVTCRGEVEGVRVWRIK